jgi:predicted O-methyltransferase YrrM
MQAFEKVRASFDALPYMRHDQALFLQRFVAEHDARDVLEVGFYQGKSSAYIAAILEDLGRGHLISIDRASARRREPNIEGVLAALDLSHRVTPVYAHRSYTWELAKMIREAPRPQFDLCYFDAGHTWDETGFGFLLVDMLLKPGGWIVFDDLKWTIDAALPKMSKPPKGWVACSEDERATPAVGLVFELLVPHLGYTEVQSVLHGSWGVARKPLAGARSQGRGMLARMKQLAAGRSVRN